MAVADTSAITTKTTSWTLIVRVSNMSGPLIEVVGRDQWIARGVGARHLADGAAPLEFQFGQPSLKTGAGEEVGIEPAQRQVRDDGLVGVVTALPFRQRALGV